MKQLIERPDPRLEGESIAQVLRSAGADSGGPSPVLIVSVQAGQHYFSRLIFLEIRFPLSRSS